MINAGALLKADYTMRKTGECQIANCQVTLRDIGGGIYDIVIRSRNGSLVVIARDENILIRNEAGKVVA